MIGRSDAEAMARRAFGRLVNDVKENRAAVTSTAH
jgi:hypothetical protein